MLVFSWLQRLSDACLLLLTCQTIALRSCSEAYKKTAWSYLAAPSRRTRVKMAHLKADHVHDAPPHTPKKTRVAVAKSDLLLLPTLLPSVQLPCKQDLHISCQVAPHMKLALRDEPNAMDLPR